ncbi:MAG: hypothetical protein JEY99_01225 [Spirochaetales bacterium]|nr:hypothetical protein [Spirochaetales bacterium]
MKCRILIITLLLTQLIIPAVITADESFINKLVEKIEYTGTVEPQFYSAGFGTALDFGLLLPLRLFDDFKIYGATTVSLQGMGAEVQTEVDLLLNLKGWGEIWSYDDPEKNILSIMTTLFKRPDSGPYRVGAAASLAAGTGIINYWLNANKNYKPLNAYYIQLGGGVFLDSPLFMMNIDLCYQIDFIDSTPRTFINIPVSITIHKPVFTGENK